MNEVHYGFVELETEHSFRMLAKDLGGQLQGTTIHFDNLFAKGQLIKVKLEEGLWIRKWKFTVFKKIVLHRLAAPEGTEKKFSLIYFLNPSIFELKEKASKSSINRNTNSVLVYNRTPMDFSVVPRHPFCVLDITFSYEWIVQQIREEDPFRQVLLSLLSTTDKNIVKKCCQPEEYKILNEIDVFVNENTHDDLFIRSRVYQLICNFIYKRGEESGKMDGHSSISYDQLAEVQSILLNEMRKPLKIETMAKMVNMSSSSLQRQFKKMFGQTIQEFLLQRKMELAKKMIMEKRMSVKQVALDLGYGQPSHFIETFTRIYGISPGNIKADHYR